MPKRAKLTVDQIARRRIAKKVAAANAKALADVGPLFVDQAALVNKEEEYWKWRKWKATVPAGAMAADLASVDYKFTLRMVQRLAREYLTPEDYAIAAAHHWHGDDLMFWRNVLTGNQRIVLSYWRHVFGCRSIERSDGPPFFVEKRIECGEALVWPRPGWVPPLTGAEFDALVAVPTPKDFEGAIDPLRLKEVDDGR